jgi:hypothetical protein
MAVEAGSGEQLVPSRQRRSPSTRQQQRLIPSRQRASSFGKTARLLPSWQHIGSSLMGAELAASSFRRGALDLSHDTEKIRYDQKKEKLPSPAKKIRLVY